MTRDEQLRLIESAALKLGPEKCARALTGRPGSWNVCALGKAYGEWGELMEVIVSTAWTASPIGAVAQALGLTPEEVVAVVDAFDSLYAPSPVTHDELVAIFRIYAEPVAEPVAAELPAEVGVLVAV